MSSSSALKNSKNGQKSVILGKISEFLDIFFEITDFLYIFQLKSKKKDDDAQI